MRSMAEGGGKELGWGSPKAKEHMREWKSPFPTPDMDLQERPGLCLGSPEQILTEEQQCCLHQHDLLLMGPGRRQKLLSSSRA